MGAGQAQTHTHTHTHTHSWHFRQLAQDNQAAEAHLESVVPLLSAHPSGGNGECLGFLAIGSQWVSKFPPMAQGANGQPQPESGRREGPRQRVRIYLGVFRDVRYALDYLLVLNVPQEDGEGEEEGGELVSGGREQGQEASMPKASKADIRNRDGEEGLPPALQSATAQQQRDLFVAICNSFRVLDPSLFVQ